MYENGVLRYTRGCNGQGLRVRSLTHRNSNFWLYGGEQKAKSGMRCFGVTRYGKSRAA